MAIFATPEFGASLFFELFWLIVGAVVLLLAAVGMILGVKRLKSVSSARRKVGVLLLLVSGLFPVFCFLAPPYIFRLGYGSYPIGSYPINIREGMSSDEVKAILGTPHQRDKEKDGERWLYWIDPYGIHWCCLEFGPDGHMIRRYGN